MLTKESNDEEIFSPHLLAACDDLFGDEHEQNYIHEEGMCDLDGPNDTTISSIFSKVNHTRDISSISTTPFALLEDEANENFLNSCVMNPDTATDFLEKERQKILESQEIEKARKVMRQKNDELEQQSNLNCNEIAFSFLVQLDDVQLVFGSKDPNTLNGNPNKSSCQQKSKSLTMKQRHRRYFSFVKHDQNKDTTIDLQEIVVEAPVQTHKA